MVFEINGIEFFDSIRKIKKAYANNPIKDGDDKSEDIAYDLLVDKMSREDFDDFLDTLTDDEYIDLTYFTLKKMKNLNHKIKEYTDEQSNVG